MRKTVSINIEITVGEAIARALLHAGVKVVTCVPATGVTDVFNHFNLIRKRTNPISFNEEPAYTVVHGAAIAGTRAAALTKSHGIVKAGNSVSDSLFTGTTAGMLAIVFTDKTGIQSDSILEIEPFLKGIGIPHQMADMHNIYRQIFRLLDHSEKLRLPHALVIDSSEINKPVKIVETVNTDDSIPIFRRNIFQHILCPFFAEYQSSVLNYKINNRDWSQLPLPENPHLPDSLPEKWKQFIAIYSPLFSQFQKIRGPVVTGDTGISTLFACEPYNCVDITTYMGGSIPLAVGACMGGHRGVWAVTGDFSFIAAGHMGLLEAWQRHLPLKILILYNGMSATTGGQPIPENTLETVLRGYESCISYINDPQNIQEVEMVLRKAQSLDKLAIVVADFREQFGKR
jgi:TPP-dependent indolepyruvate ferredoxin oxidoreductase alpha subunit